MSSTYYQHIIENARIRNNQESFRGRIDLQGKRFGSADLKGFDLSNFDFKGANFSNANLSNTNLTNTSFKYANLNGADLTNSFVLQESYPDFTDISYNESTKFPVWFTPSRMRGPSREIGFNAFRSSIPISDVAFSDVSTLHPFQLDGKKKKKKFKSKKKKSDGRRKRSKCRSYLKKKIKINLSEKKKYLSRKQAIAVAYSQVKRDHPACKRILSRKIKS